MPVGRDVNTDGWCVEQFLPGRWESYDVDKKTGLTKLSEQGKFYEIGVTVPTFKTDISPTSKLIK